MLFAKKSFRLICLILLPILGTSQVVKPNTFGNVFIRSGGFMTIHGQHNFMEGSGFLKPGIVKTARNPIPGTLNYSKTSGWSGASESQYVDGYVKSFHKSGFTYPIGHKGYYRPIALSHAYSSYAAYYRQNPLNISDYVSSEVENISTKEYWTIHLFEASKVTLTWAIDSDISQLESMTIVGLNKATNEWELIPSAIDEYSLNVSVHGSIFNTNTKSKHSIGSITSLNEVPADTYTEFTIASLSPNLFFGKPEITVYPNPQLVGSDIMLDYKLGNDKGLVVVYKSDNSLLYSFELTEAIGRTSLPYPISESGSYIIGISDAKGQTSFQNLILVDK